MRNFSASLNQIINELKETVEPSKLPINGIVGCSHAPVSPGFPSPPSQLEVGINTKIDVMGAYLFLCQHSKPHQHYPLGQLGTRVIPALNWDSYRLYLSDDIPVAYVNWTWVSDEVDAMNLTGKGDVDPDDWHEGANLWFMEVLAPFGHSFELMMDLHENVFSGPLTAKATYLDTKGDLAILRNFSSFI